MELLKSLLRESAETFGIQSNILAEEIASKVETLTEAVNAHLQAAASVLGRRSSSDADLKGIDIGELASIVASLKALSKAEYRDSMTKDDIGINPRSAKDLFTFFDKIPSSEKGKLTGLPKEVVTALSKLVPSVNKSELEKYLKAVAQKIDLSYDKIKSAAMKAASEKVAMNESVDEFQFEISDKVGDKFKTRAGEEVTFKKFKRGDIVQRVFEREDGSTIIISTPQGNVNFVGKHKNDIVARIEE
jgi:Cu/Ag efflux protein CusF